MKIVLLFFLAAFVDLTGSTRQANEITVYSHRHYDSDDALYRSFEESTGIRVNVVRASADELIERLRAEGSNTPADLLITADAGRLQRAKDAGLLHTVTSDVLNNRIPSPLRDPEGAWYGFTQRARIIVYAKDRVNPSSLSTYEDLASSKWRGRLLARSSSNIYNQSLLASIIAADGQKEALEWAKAVRQNMARPPQGSDRDQMRAVAAGLADVAIVNTYYVGLLVNSADEKDREAGAKLGLFFPNQNGRGAHINVSGAAVTKASKNKDAAVRLLEFLASDQAQRTFPVASHEYPAVPGVEWSPLQKQWGTFKADTLNLSTLGALNEAAVETFNLAGWE